MNSRRSKSSSLATSAGRPMKTWRIAGSTAFTRSPRSELSTGTSRQPITLQAFGRDDLLDDFAHLPRACASRGMKNWPIA